MATLPPLPGHCENFQRFVHGLRLDQCGISKLLGPRKMLAPWECDLLLGVWLSNPLITIELTCLELDVPPEKVVGNMFFFFFFKYVLVQHFYTFQNKG